MKEERRGRRVGRSTSSVMSVHKPYHRVTAVVNVRFIPITRVLLPPPPTISSFLPPDPPLPPAPLCTAPRPPVPPYRLCFSSAYPSTIWIQSPSLYSPSRPGRPLLTSLNGFDRCFTSKGGPIRRYRPPGSNSFIKSL